MQTRKVRLSLLWMVPLVALLLGCSGAVNEPLAQTEEDVRDSAAVDLSSPLAQSSEDSAGAVPTLTPENPSPAAEQEKGSSGAEEQPGSSAGSALDDSRPDAGADDGSLPSAGAVSPVEVDLGSLTPQPFPDEGMPIEAPQPGVPNPALSMAHIAAMDLAKRLNIDVGAVLLVEQEEVTWPDRGLGCPDPNMAYPSVLTDGFQIVLAAEGQNYTYHTNLISTVILCEDGAPVPAVAPAVYDN